MIHLPLLIKDLALILAAAAVFAVIFKRLKQPVVLGYILAGLLVNKNVQLFPSVMDSEGVKIWAEMGVIFLLFALGLEFSFKKLLAVGPSAVVTGIYEVGFMLLLGFTAGTMMGWPFIDSLFLGGIICISSTTIIFRAFDELGIRTKQFTRLVMGILVLEDLVAVLLMVTLSTLAVSREFEGMETLLSLGKLLFFLSLWFVFGIFLLPSLLKLIGKWINNEMLLIITIALCLVMVVLANYVGFSSALGAFIMGSVLAETLHAEKIHKLVKSVKHLFGAIFFVSVGLIVDLQMLYQHIGTVVLITLLVIFGKTFFVSTGALLSGKPLKLSLQTGTSMSQIGEFSFIIATIGLTLNVTSGFLYALAVGVSIITVFATPYMIKLSDVLYNLLIKWLPAHVLESIDRYSAGSENLKSETDWQRVLKDFVWIIIGNGVVMLALVLVSVRFVAPWLETKLADFLLSHIVLAILTLTLMAPFIWALTGKRIRGTAYKALWLKSGYNRGPLVALELLRNGVAVLLTGLLLYMLFEIEIALTGTVIVLIIVLVIFNQRLNKFYHRLEKRFISNLHAKEKLVRLDHLSPWDAHLVNYELPAEADFFGIPLGKLQWREKFGINIAFIERGTRLIIAPTEKDVLYPYDLIGVIGTDHQLHEFSAIVTHPPEDEINSYKDNIELQQISVNEYTRLKGVSIKASRLTAKTNGIVVGLERNGERILNPPSDMVLEWGDIVWIVGDKRKIKSLLGK